MHFEILSLFPDFFTSPLQSSLLWKAQEKGIFSVGITNIREFSKRPNKGVDDSPYGGGAGMVMDCESVAGAIRSARKNFPHARVFFFSPSGKPFTQRDAERLANDSSPKILLCGHYEGIDERVIESEVDETFCIGEAVLTGGELPALFLVDAVTRLLPGTIGKEQSHKEESFSLSLFGAKEYPHYTRPEIWEGKAVPKELLSGNHTEIEEWRYSNLKNLSPPEQKILSLRRKKFSPQKPYKFSWKGKNGWEKGFLRVHEKSDIEYWMKWMNDYDVTRFLTVSPPLSRKDEERYFEWSHTNLNGLFVTICDTKKIPIGNVSLIIDEQKPHIARFGLTIGEKEWWGKGLGTAVTNEVLKIAFEDLGVEKVGLDVFIENTPAIQVYEKCGFRRVGTIQKHYAKRGGFEDGFLYEKVL